MKTHLLLIRLIYFVMFFAGSLEDPTIASQLELETYLSSRYVFNKSKKKVTATCYYTLEKE